MSIAKASLLENMKRIEIRYIDTNSVDIKDYLFSEYISPKERKIIAKKYSNETAKKEAIASTYFKNKYIGDYHLDDNNKPVSDNTFFNVSHSKGFVIFAKDDVKIGIDVEKIREQKERLKGYIFSSEENEYIKDDYSFYELWTNKEALVKAYGLGIVEKVKDIPSLPINDVKVYRGIHYLTKTIRFGDYVITVARESQDDYEMVIIQEKRPR